MAIISNITRVKSLFVVVVLSLIGVVGTKESVYANFPPVVQTYYVPLSEPALFEAMLSIFPAPGCPNAPAAPPVANPLTSIISIVATADSTIYYDHWEDGFEVDIGTPIQPTTQIWGDGNDINGIPPGFTTDFISTGTHIELNNPVDINNPLAIDFDGGDKISASRAIVVSRVGWPTGPESGFAGAAELLDLTHWGTDYEIPVDGLSDTYQTFEHVSLFLTAAESNTVISIDRDGDGLVDVVQTLNEGQSHHENGGLTVGARITSTKPVQAHLVSGDICTAYETRWYTLLPTAVWDDSYYMPVTTSSAYPTSVFLYNPHTFPIDITWTQQSGPGGLVTVLPLQSQLVTMPTVETAVHFESAGFPFYALAAIDRDDSYDWGFALWPEQKLTQRAQVAWGPGHNPKVGSAENGNPVWVTAVPENASQTVIKLCVDYEGDGVDDIFYMLAPLASEQILTSVADQTGLRLSICDGSGAKVAAAWGPQPGLATAGPTGIDLGTAVVPLSDFEAGLGAAVLNDADNDGLPSGGDTLRYTVMVQNTNLPSIGNIEVTSAIPANTSYILNSTTVDYGSGPQPIADSGVTPFPLDEGGQLLSGAGGQNPVTVEFEATVDALLPANAQTIAAEATVAAAGQQRLLDVETLLNFEPALLLAKTVYEGHDSGASCAGTEDVTAMLNAPLTYCFEITNTGDTYLDSLTIDDASLAISIADLAPLGTTTWPLAPSTTAAYYYETTLTADLLNTAVAAAVPVDSQGNPHPQLLPVQDDDTAAVHVTQTPTVTPTVSPTVPPTITPTPIPAPVTIGNIVWLDANGNGLQDASEVGLPNVTVRLYSHTNQLLAKTVTDSIGQYLFDGNNVAVGLQPDTPYRIKLNNPTNFRPNAVLGDTILASPNAGADDIDSDGIYDKGGYPTINLVTVSGTNADYDFGLRYGNCRTDIGFTMAAFGPGTASVQNNSSGLSYVVGLAIYQKTDNTIVNQKLFDFQLIDLAPQQSANLQVDLPDTAAQIDLFCGPVLYSLKNQRYGLRLLAAQHLPGPFAPKAENQYARTQPIDNGIDDPEN